MNQGDLHKNIYLFVAKTFMYTVNPSPRVRASPYYDATVAEGVSSFTSYNQMLLPTSYGDPEGEYWRLVNGVSMWDVAAQRQVQLSGTDATHLAHILTVRDLTDLSVGRAKYAPICNHSGTLINDPVVNRVDENLYWFSIADSNILLFARAIAAERNLQVEVTEPDVSPLAIQGPKAVNVVSAIFGEWVRNLRHFEFRNTSIEGIPVLVSRSGWSKQGGFELYLQDSSKGLRLWKFVREAGQPWDIKPGTPNHSERIESGLLSIGTDTDDSTNPFEVRLGHFVNLDLPKSVIGISALRRIKQNGVKRQQLGIRFSADLPKLLNRNWFEIRNGKERIGHITSLSFSYRFECNIGLALVKSTMHPGNEVTVRIDKQNSYSGTLVNLPFVEKATSKKHNGD